MPTGQKPEACPRVDSNVAKWNVHRERNIYKGQKIAWKHKGHNNIYRSIEV